MKMFSEEWFNAVVDALKADDEFQRKAEGFDSGLQFKVLKDPKAGVDKDVAFGMWLPSAEPNWYGPRPDEDVDIILEGKAGKFKEVLTAKKNVITDSFLTAVTMAGEIIWKKGSMSKLSSNVGTWRRFLEVVSSVS
ncbi:hypothetical protein [Desulfoglaeba alkanexedens]|uniref:SCP2 domain-containing protein n=1 Tax=Desulfoglaeba alkanexedens ALDC TaxID=980445 RepID=A0A4P8L4W5_9BACT|nr:hypothetical protein [Desulfoglaeba alkanexedens]QCQ23056.1 hypothetical protein FDQ92_13275 [Desulfoglaeba alkanexedens ALDC]